MIAPVPYSYRTKFATQIGIGSSVRGFTAQAPVKTPSFSRSAAVRSAFSCRETRATNSRTAFASGRPSISRSTSGDSGARLMKVAPKIVSWRVVKIRIAGRADSGSGRGEATPTPLLPPIQLRCMVSTRRRPGGGRTAPARQPPRESGDRENPPSHPEAPADPVALHGQHARRPGGEPIAAGQQLLGVSRDPEEPLLQLLLDHHALAPPAAAFLHLLVGEHGLAARAPVHRGPLLVRETLLVELEEEPLVPCVVVRLARRDLAAPVVGEPQALQLVPHVLNVLGGPLRGVHALFDRRVLRRQAEGVPAHWVQDIVAAHRLEPCQHVPDGIVTHMAHVDAARGVGEHLQAVELGTRGVFGHTEGLLLSPFPLPFYFDLLGIVRALAHRRESNTLTGGGQETGVGVTGRVGP